MNNDPAVMKKKLRELDFVIHEAVLYLDGHPNNKKAMDFYKKTKDMRDVLYSEYTTDYAPMFSEDVRQDYWSWIDSPWPWQNGKEA